MVVDDANRLQRPLVLNPVLCDRPALLLRETKGIFEEISRTPDTKMCRMRPLSTYRMIEPLPFTRNRLAALRLVFSRFFHRRC